MALLLEQTLHNADVVRYHRISAYEMSGTTIVVTLDSFRTREQRAMPIAPVISRKYPFVYSDSTIPISDAAYSAIKALPEWKDSVDS